MNKRVLVIDDSATILELTRHALGAAGFDVTGTDDAAQLEALNANGEIPDLILVDVNMPQFFGDDIVAFVRAEWPVQTLMYLFSNMPETELAQRAQECGADGYISKEWGLERLVDEVRRILA